VKGVHHRPCRKWRQSGAVAHDTCRPHVTCHAPTDAHLDEAVAVGLRQAGFRSHVKPCYQASWHG
jgi:hypothetical protein